MRQDLIVEFLRGWLASTYGLRVSDAEVTEVALHRFQAAFEASGRAVQVEGGVLYGELLSPPFESRLRLFEAEAGRGLKGALILWVPPGASIPVDVPALQSLVTTLRDTAKELEPGEVRDLALPAKLYLKKTAAEGAYITVTGGLSDHWSQMSQHVQGVYQLDSREVKRLPRDPNFVPELTDRIAALSRTMQLGDWTEVLSQNSWTFQRLHSGDGLTVLAAPEAFDPGDGTYVRRALRRLVREMGERLASAPADLRILLLVTSLTSMAEENIGPALVGFDPALYAPIDLLCLAADGELKAVLQPPAGSLDWLTASPS